MDDVSTALPSVTQTPGQPRSAAEPTAGATAALVATLALALTGVLLVFSWTAARTAPHHVPVAVAGPHALAEAGARGLAASRPGALDVRVLPDEAAGRAALRERQVYGVVLLEDQGLRLLVASAASPRVREELVSVLSGVQARSQGTTLQVEDVVPAPADDPDGAVPAAALLALGCAAVAAGIVVPRQVGRRRDVPVALVAFALAGGVGAELVLHPVLRALTGDVAAEGGVLALAVLAVSAATAGAGLLARQVGGPAAAVVLVVLGYPVAGLATAPELVPSPWGAIGRLLPLGAAGTALRDVSFFPAAAPTWPVLLLAGWAVAGLAAVTAAGRVPTVTTLLRRRRPAASATA